MALGVTLLTGHEAPYPVHLGPGTDCPVGDESVFVKFSPPAARDRIFVPSARVFRESKGKYKLSQRNTTLLYCRTRTRLFAIACIVGITRGSLFNIWVNPGKDEFLQSSRELISARYIGFLVGSSKFYHYNE